MRVVGFRPRDVGLWLGALVVLAAAACSGEGGDVVRADGPPGEREAELVWAELQDPLTLLLSVGACNAENNQATVDETAEAVTVTVVTDDPSGGADCADGVRVVLDEPLGVRELIDGSTGQAVEVHER